MRKRYTHTVNSVFFRNGILCRCYKCRFRWKGKICSVSHFYSCGDINAKLADSDTDIPLVVVWHRRETEHVRTGRIVDKVKRKARLGLFCL